MTTHVSSSLKSNLSLTEILTRYLASLCLLLSPAVAQWHKFTDNDMHESIIDFSCVCQY